MLSAKILFNVHMQLHKLCMCTFVFTAVATWVCEDLNTSYLLSYSTWLRTLVRRLYWLVTIIC